MSLKHNLPEPLQGAGHQTPPRMNFRGLYLSRRFVSIILAVVFHLIILFFAVFTIKTSADKIEERSGVMRLVDVREEQPRRPKPEESAVQNTSEEAAETIIETEEILPPAENTGPALIAEEIIEYLPMSKVTALPQFSDDEIKRKMIYPPIAQRAGIEGFVILELFVDVQGLVRNVSILKEEPADRGFGEAALRAYQGLKGNPGRSSSENVAVRFRRRVVFTLK